MKKINHTKICSEKFFEQMQKLDSPKEVYFDNEKYCVNQIVKIIEVNNDKYTTGRTMKLKIHNVSVDSQILLCSPPRIRTFKVLLVEPLKE